MERNPTSARFGTREPGEPGDDERWQLAQSKPMFRTPAADQADPSQGAGSPAQSQAPARAQQPGRVQAPETIARLAQPVAPKLFQASQEAALAAAAEARERRDSHQPSERMIGQVSSCSGAKAVISTSATHLTGASSEFWSVGKMISIEGPSARIVGMVSSMHTASGSWAEGKSNDISVEVELIGEVTDNEARGTTFRRGISNYPPLGAVAHRIRARDLEAMHDVGRGRGIEVGTLSQNASLPARINVDDLLCRHFAVLGTTGVGKSSAITLLVRQAVAAVPTLRVLMLDPHDEFMAGLGNVAVPLDVADLNLPYWLFRFEELEDVIFRGHPVADESDVLRELVAAAKLHRRGGRAGGAVSADLPVPYRMSDVIALIDDMLGHLEPRFERVLLRSLKVRIDGLMNDPRYGFLFASGGIDDSFDRIISTIFRLPAHNKPVSVLNLAAVPSDVLNAVVSVLARLAFDVAYASKGQLNVLLVCEEAHRYVPNDAAAGFLPTRRAIARIAKEGRKYGCAVAIVTQRPGELDPTILSQCSTVFAMRLTNDRDQDIIRSAISDSSSSTISFLSALDNREAIAFGEAVAAPMRLYFTYQDRASLPSVGLTGGAKLASADDLDVAGIVATLRRTSAPARRIVESESNISGPGGMPEGPATNPAPAIPRAQSALGLRTEAQAAAANPVRASLLKRPLDSL